MPWFALLLLLSAHSPASLAGPAQDPLARLRVWVERTRLSGRPVDTERGQELRAILGELRIQRASDGADERSIDGALLELASLGWGPSLEVEGEPRGEDGLRSLALLGRNELETALRREGQTSLAAWLAAEVIEPEKRRRREERCLAAELLSGCYLPETLGPLRRAAREDDPDLRRAALAALCGWPEPAAHVFFLEELELGEPPYGVIGEHFVRARASLSTGALDRLRLDVARLCLSEDWRAATRGLPLVQALDTERAVPLLIEALALWDRRTRAGQGSRRVRSEIVAELQRLSGRSLGPDPAHWGEWWEAVCAGRIALPEEIRAAGGEVSSATFFGLRPVTDKVVFVVDCSGSMGTLFGTGGRTRYEEAIEQLARFLRQSGQQTRFSVALFNDQGVAWKSHLVPATEASLDQVRRWLVARPPGGQTLLFEGLRAALGLDSRGRLAPEKVEADTVIVLCDGATSEGPAWVAPWLAENNERAKVVFHCIQIGVGGNGTLESLAKGSGGEFVRVQG